MHMQQHPGPMPPHHQQHPGHQQHMMHPHPQQGMPPVQPMFTIGQQQNMQQPGEKKVSKRKIPNNKGKKYQKKKAKPPKVYEYIQDPTKRTKKFSQVKDSIFNTCSKLTQQTAASVVAIIQSPHTAKPYVWSSPGIDSLPEYKEAQQALANLLKARTKKAEEQEWTVCFQKLNDANAEIARLRKELDPTMKPGDALPGPLSAIGMPLPMQGPGGQQGPGQQQQQGPPGQQQQQQGGQQQQQPGQPLVTGPIMLPPHGLQINRDGQITQGMSIPMPPLPMPRLLPQEQQQQQQRGGQPQQPQGMPQPPQIPAPPFGMPLTAQPHPTGPPRPAPTASAPLAMAQ